MDFDNMTIKQGRELAGMFGGTNVEKAHRWVIGEAYFIQTVTHYWLGVVTHVDEHEIELRDAAWVADTGRFAKCMAEGAIQEMEPCPDGLSLVGRGAVVHAQRWHHAIPRIVIEE